MADLRGKNLPNLKISVDNTASSEEGDSESESLEEEEVIVGNSNILEEISDSEDEEFEEKEVEFNVRLGSYSKGSNSASQNHGQEISESKSAASTLENKKYETSESKPELPRLSRTKTQLPEKRVYENKGGNFITGIDVTSKEAVVKRQERAKRFGIKEEKDQIQWNVEDLYNSLGITESDFEKEELGLRKEAIHIYGTDNMSTKDVFDYFSEFGPSAIEWIDDSSCNAVWLDKVTAARALMKLSLSYEVAMERQRATEKKKKLAIKTKDLEGIKNNTESITELKEAENFDDETTLKNSTEKTTIAKSIQAESTESATCEKMDLDEDDDELDLMVDDNTEVITKKMSNPKEENGADKVLLGKCENEKKQYERHKELGKSRSETRKHTKKQKKESEESDIGSKTASTSESESSSGSESSSSSDSNSSSGSELDSISSSEPELELMEARKNKKKLDKDTGELLPKGYDQNQKKYRTIHWPPGKWRLGVPCKKARYLFLRFATKDDRKQPGAERKSQYYRKYGNPNYKGMKGLISTSRKRKIRREEIDKDIKSHGPDAREMITNKQKLKNLKKEVEEKEDGEISSDEPEMLGDLQADDDQVVQIMEKPKDLRQLLNRESGQSSIVAAKSKPAEVLEQAMTIRTAPKRILSTADDEMDFDAELEHLLEAAPKKRVMRMRADEEEERLKAKKARAGLLTVVASSTQSGVRSRLGSRLDHAQHLRSRNDDGDDDFAVPDEEDEYFDKIIPDEEDDYISNEVSSDVQQLGSSAVCDLRSKLSSRKRTSQTDRKLFQSMRIEVLD